jgi:glutathione-regulated potassium-efflux system ancillary protein KefF
MITLIYAHPYPLHSRANRALLEAVRDLPGLQIRDLYALYPDFHIDSRAEQEALVGSATVVLQHPLHWYHAPALLSLWVEQTLAYGWAYGHDPAGQPTRALENKRLLWAVSTGGAERAYQPEGYNHHTMAAIATPIRQTGVYCGLQWLEPHIVHGAHQMDAAALAAAAQTYRARLRAELDHLSLSQER